MTEEELEDRTDGHMDVNRVRTGAVLIAPVKVEGGGVYVGDMHAMQGDGEIAGHTADVAGIVSLQVNVLKDVNLRSEERRVGESGDVRDRGSRRRQHIRSRRDWSADVCVSDLWSDGRESC